MSYLPNNLNSDQFFTISILLFFICHIFLNILEIHILENLVLSILLFLTRNCYGRWVILSFSILFFLIAIEFSYGLVGQQSEIGFYT